MILDGAMSRWRSLWGWRLHGSHQSSVHYFLVIWATVSGATSCSSFRAVDERWWLAWAFGAQHCCVRWPDLPQLSHWKALWRSLRFIGRESGKWRLVEAAAAAWLCVDVWCMNWRRFSSSIIAALKLSKLILSSKRRKGAMTPENSSGNEIIRFAADTISGSFSPCPLSFW